MMRQVLSFLFDRGLMTVLLLALTTSGGCSGDVKPSATAGSAEPSLDAKDASERSAAAREAAEKYGAKP